MLVRALEQHQAELGVLQADLQVDFGRLSSAGGTPTMLLERLVEVDRQDRPSSSRQEPKLRHCGNPPCRISRLPWSGALSMRRMSAAQRWIVETADMTVANVLYLELPADRLVRLLAPVWIDGQARASVSLFARSDELSGRDRLALVAAARAVATADAGVPPQLGATIRGQPYGAVVVRAHHASVQELAEAAHLRFEPLRGEVSVDRQNVRAYLPYESHVRWRRQIAEWHAGLSADLGVVSLGHAVRSGPEASDAHVALVQAAEAALLGDDLFGPGHVTSYADAQLARFLLYNRQAHELGALYERAVGKLAAEDLKRESDLVSTLEVYCETVATQGTAARLGIHRNTVLYRLKLIEEITAVDLNDGSSRLFLQLGLLAGRLVRRSSGSRLRVDAAVEGPQLSSGGGRASTMQARTA